MALSRYNTGDVRRGFANGYVQKVTRAAAQIVPALHASPGFEDPGGEAPSKRPARRGWDVFGEASPAPRFLIRTSDVTPPTGGAQ